MLHISLYRLAVLGVSAVSLGLSTAVTAVPFVIDNIEPSGFDCATASPPSGAGSLSCVTTTPNHIEWVQGSTPVSSLDLTSLTPAIINPGGADVDFFQLTHTNIVIPTGFGYSIDIVNTVQLMDVDGNEIVLTAEGRVGIFFTETVNALPCPPPNPNGSICDDFFDFDATGLAPLPFSSDEVDYLLIFGLRAGPGTVVVGNTVYTAESSVSDLFVTVRIAPRPASEPASLTLAGLGLLALAFTTLPRKL